MNKICFVKLILILSLYNSCVNNKFNKTTDHSISQQSVKLNDSAVNLLYQNSLLSENERLENAIHLLNQAIKIDSSYYLAYFNKKSFEVKLKLYNDAIITSKKLIRLRPLNADNYLFIGEVYEKLMDTVSAIPYFKDALPLYSRELDTMSVKNMRYKSLQISKAITLLKLGDRKRGKEILTELYNKETDTLFKKEYLNILKDDNSLE